MRCSNACNRKSLFVFLFRWFSLCVFFFSWWILYCTALPRCLSLLPNDCVILIANGSIWHMKVLGRRGACYTSKHSDTRKMTRSSTRQARTLFSDMIPFYQDLSVSSNVMQKPENYSSRREGVTDSFSLVLYTGGCPFHHLSFALGG